MIQVKSEINIKSEEFIGNTVGEDVCSVVGDVYKKDVGLRDIITKNTFKQRNLDDVIDSIKTIIDISQDELVSYSLIDYDSYNKLLGSIKYQML